MLREHSAGERNKRITIQQLTQTEDASGMPLETWTTLTTAQASYLPLGGRERLSADHLTSPFDGQFQMAYRPDMDPNLLNVPKLRRVVYQGRVHDIVAAAMVGEKRAVELMTASGGATA